MFTRRLSVFIALFFILSCKQHDNSALMDENLNHEIQNRLVTLQQLGKSDDTIEVISKSLHSEVEKLILLSCDLENYFANIAKANEYFLSLSKVIPASTEGPILVQNFMKPHEAQLLIKQNELWMLNNLIFLRKGGNLRLFSVKEDLSKGY